MYCNCTFSFCICIETKDSSKELYVSTHPFLGDTVAKMHCSMLKTNTWISAYSMQLYIYCK